jgi:SAM-dependent methyltransferase
MRIIHGMEAPPGLSERVSTSLARWFETPLGRYLREREQAYFDQTVADIFGFHAVQIGLPDTPFLAQCRIASRWTLDYDPPANIIADPHGLPFAENALDLLVLPHALEFTDDPHLLLRETYRVIRPEGQIVISGFNPFSLLGARRYFGRARTPPWNGNFIALYRLKDWLALLGFDVVGGRLDGYVPPVATEKWLHRLAFLEKAGDRWWPIAGGVYFLRATKKVLGMRVLAPAWQRRERREKALAPTGRAREGLTTHRLAVG